MADLMGQSIMTYSILILLCIGMTICTYCVIMSLIGSIDLSTSCIKEEANKKKVADTCNKNCQCENGACGRESAKAGTPVTCCKSGKSENVISAGALDFCTEMPDGEQCWLDTNCASGRCINNGDILLPGTKIGTCGKAEVGGKCTLDDDCKNGACGRESADDNVPKVCCKSGAVDRSLANQKDYCTQMPDGARCWVNKNCASGRCINNGPMGLEGTERGTCGQAEVGAKCTYNADCKNNACGRESAKADTPKTCCKVGPTHAANGSIDYCSGMPDDEVCFLDDNCASGYCRNNGTIPGTERGICGKLKDGESCTVSRACLSGLCRANGIAGGGDGKCGLGQDGEVCMLDTDCVSKYCRGNSSGLGRGVCGKLKDGEACTISSDCLSERCRANGIAGGGEGKCGLGQDGEVCMLDADCKTGHCRDNGFPAGTERGVCGLGKGGEVCRFDNDCVDKICLDNYSGMARGKCAILKEVNQSCSGDSDCRNKACGRNAGVESPLICCPGSQKSFISPSGFYYCENNLERGQVCSSNKQCKTGHCSSGFTGNGVCD
jgi:hypothetical protein